MTKLVNHFLLFGLLFCLITQCANKSDIDILWDKLIEKGAKKNLDKKKVILIIPGAGCTGCISSAQYFVVDHIDKLEDLGVVFTGVGSKKSLKVELGQEIYYHKRILIDTTNSFYLQGLTDIYPTLTYISGTRIDSIVHQSPENPNALNKLIKHLEGG